MSAAVSSGTAGSSGASGLIPAAGGGAPASPGHAGVTEWVAANSAITIAHVRGAHPDASDETGNLAAGTYTAGVVAATIDGEAAFDPGGPSAGVGLSFADDPDLDLIRAGFAVIDLDSLPSTSHILDRDTFPGREWQFRINSAGALQFLNMPGSGHTLSSANGLIAVGQRYTVGFACDGTNLRLFIDGVVVATDGTTAIGTGDAPFGVGRSVYDSPGPSIDGAVASAVLLSDGAQALIIELHDAWMGDYVPPPPPPPPPGPDEAAHGRVGSWVTANAANVNHYYLGDDAAASAAMTDERGALNGTWSASGVATRVVNDSTVADLNGTTGYGLVANAASLNVTGIFCVVEFDNAPAAIESVLTRDTSAERNWQFRRTAAGKIQLLRVHTGNPTVTGATTLAQSTEYTLGAIYDGTNTILYVNGVADGSVAGNLLETGTSDLYVGALGYTTPNAFMTGAIGSVVLLGTVDANTIPDLHNAWVGA